MGEAVYTVNRLRAILDNPDTTISPTLRQRLTEELEAAVARGQSTVTINEPTHPTRPPTPTLFDQ